MSWHINLLSIDPFLELLPILNGHNSRNNWDSDSSSSDPLDPIKEDVDIIEQLSEDEFGSSIDFLFQPVDLLLFAFWCIGTFGMSLRETSYCDTEVTGVIGVNVFD